MAAYRDYELRCYKRLFQRLEHSWKEPDALPCDINFALSLLFLVAFFRPT